MQSIVIVDHYINSMITCSRVAVHNNNLEMIMIRAAYVHDMYGICCTNCVYCQVRDHITHTQPKRAGADYKELATEEKGVSNSVALYKPVLGKVRNHCSEGQASNY